MRTVLFEGSECWALGEAQEGQLLAARMRMLWWACGCTRRERVWNEDVRIVMKTSSEDLRIPNKVGLEASGERPKGVQKNSRRRSPKEQPKIGFQ